MKPYNEIMNHVAAYNPCLGCTSAACVFCEYSTDRRDWSKEPDKHSRTHYFRLSAQKREERGTARSMGTTASTFAS